MTKKIYILIISLIAPIYAVSAANTCSIFIHGYTSNNENYFGDLPRQVLWDSSQNIEEASLDVAQGIIEQMDTCEDDDLIILRPHSYGVSQVLYILGLGKRFQDTYPDNKFVKIYKRTFEVFSYTGAFHGTPLMNIVCSSRLTRKIGKFFGKSCVPSLLTNTINGPTDYVHSPGVPTYLIYSTDRSGYYGALGGIISKYKVSFFSFFFRGTRNQNDNTLPIASTKACASQKLMKKRDSTCKKIDSTFFKDYYHLTDKNHTEFLTDKEIMLMGSINED
jgi:hypothetical protein